MSRDEIFFFHPEFWFEPSLSLVVIDTDPERQLPVMLGQGRFGKVFRGTMIGIQPSAIKRIKCMESSDLNDSSVGTEPGVLHCQRHSVTDSKNTSADSAMENLPER